MAVISARGLGRQFGVNWAFRGVEFDLEQGQALAVTGPNGSGKSTLLRVVCGLLEPTEGAVQRDRLGYAALDLRLYPHLTLREHLTFAGFNHLPDVGAEGFADRACSELSTGQRARAKLALALAGDPPALLLDEPTAALDQAGRELIVKALKGRTALIATNDPADLELCSHELRLA